MATASHEAFTDNNLSKEEGEITDDDEIDEFLAGKSLLRERERHGYGYDGRFSQKFDVDSTSSSSSRNRDFSSPDRYRGRDTAGANRRYAYAEPTWSRPSPSRQETSYSSVPFGVERNNRDRYNQRDHYSQRNASYHTPDSASSWRLRRFCPSSSERNTNSENRRSSNRQQEQSSSEHDSETQRLHAELRHVHEQLKALKAQEEVKRTDSNSKESRQNSSVTANDDVESGKPDFIIDLSPATKSADSPVEVANAADGDKKEEGLSDISSQESDGLADNSCGDKGTEIRPPLSTLVAEVDAAAGIAVDSVTDASDVGTAAIDLEVPATSAVSVDDVTQSQTLTVLPGAAVSPAQVVEEEEDLDELELRRIALASAAARFKMTAEDDVDESSELSSPTKTHLATVDPLAEATLSFKTQSAAESTSIPKPKVLSQSASHSGGDSRPPRSRDSGSKSAPKSHTQKANSASTTSRQNSRPSSRRPASSRADNSSRRNETTRDGDRNSPSRQAASRERESGTSRSKSDRERPNPVRRSRPLPFAPVKIDRIRLPSVSPRAGGLRDAARRAQARARQPSVAHQLPKSCDKRGSGSSVRARKSSDEKKEEEKRKQEIAKILSLNDHEEQTERFLRLLSGVVADAKSPTKAPQLKDNYEEVEMDIDSGDEAADELRIDEFQSAMQPIPFIGADPVGFGSTDLHGVPPELLLPGGQWLPAPFIPSLAEPFPGIVNFPHSAPVQPPPPSVQPPPPPPLPADDLPQPPPPPSNQDGVGTHFAAGGRAKSAASDSLSSDISLALNYYRRSVNSGQMHSQNEAGRLREHIPFIGDALSGSEDIPFISDTKPKMEHIPFITDTLSHQEGIPFISDTKSHMEHLPFPSDTSSHNIPFISDTRNENEHSPFFSRTKFSDGHIPFISDTYDAKLPSSADTANDADITANHTSSSSNFIDRSSDSVMSSQGSRTLNDVPSFARQSQDSVIVTVEGSSISIVTREMTPQKMELEDRGSPASVSAAGHSGAESSPVVADDEDENEDQLREQLLRSLLMKRRGVENKQQASSVDSSPPVSVTASPQRSVTQKSKGVTRKVSIQKTAPAYSLFPIHKPVVVTLGESSSEDEAEEKPRGIPFITSDTASFIGGFDIDSFLKAQRKTVEEQVASPDQATDNQVDVAEQARVNRLDQERQLCLQEFELGKQRQDIVKGQNTLQQLLSKASKYLADMKRAEARANHLREQLHTTERLISRYRQLVQNSKTQAKEVRDSLLKKKETYQVTELTAMSLGQQLHGTGYKPRIPNTDVGVKRRVELVSKDAEVVKSSQPTGAKQAKLSSALTDQTSKENIPVTSTTKQSSETRKLEKERLQKLAEEYERKIRLLKSMQAQKGNQSSVAGRTVKTGNTKSAQQRTSLQKREKERLPSLEMIKLDSIESVGDSESKPRRRSLLDITQSPKPNLLMKDRNSTRGPGKALKVKPEEEGDKTKAEKIDFKMPSGVQLSNLCKIQREKIDKVLSVHTAVLSDDFPNLGLNFEPLPELMFKHTGSRGVSKEDEESRHHTLAYTSPLLHFRAYRFSPYYRTKENMTISSASFSHKLNPNRILCRYELTGTCNDQHCSWQHSRDYTLSDKEVLMDLVSYTPGLAGVEDGDSPAVHAKKIESYVDNLLTQHKGKMTTDELCLLLTSKVNECAKHTRPHTMFYESRPWRLCAKESGSLSLSLTSQFQTPADTINGVKRSPHEIDAVLDAEDVRYFVSDAADTMDKLDGSDMEGAVLAAPDDTDLWLRLAYSKLSNPTRSSEECLNHALNVLSRGLENNRHSQDLWVHYLALYRRHPDSSADFEELCQTAVHCAPCYAIWWQLLEASNGFQAKDAVCTRALDFLSADKDDAGSSVSADVRSHQVLELMLYRVTLNSQSGRFKTALNFVQSVLGVREGRESDKQFLKLLTHADTCVLWICLVHLMEFQALPAAMYSPANQNPGHIMSKDKLTIPWHTKKDLATPLDKLAGYLGQAVNPDPTLPLDLSTSPQYVQAVQNLAELLRSRRKVSEACKILEEVLKWAPHLEDVWLTAADIYAGCGQLDSAKQVLLDAVSSNAYSAKLHYHYALLEFSQGCSDDALEHMEQFVISHFESTVRDISKVDPNFLFCKLLGLETPVRMLLPPVKEELKGTMLQKDVYRWMCYCLLLEVQGEMGEAVEVFELALSSTTQAAHLALLWKCYVQFLYRRCESSNSQTAESYKQQLQEAMFRSITTAPTIVPVPFPQQHQTQRQQWRDLSHVTTLVEFYVSLVPPDTRATTLQTFYDLMPDNIPLLIRCVETALADGQLRRARSLCTAAVYDRTANLQLWKLALALAQMEGTPKEVERLYVRAVRSMPLAVSLWKDFLLFEVSQGNPVAVQTILAHCRDLELNIQGYVATISATSS